MNTDIFRQKTHSSEKHVNTQTVTDKKTNIDTSKKKDKIACVNLRNTNRRLLLEAKKQLPVHSGSPHYHALMRYEEQISHHNIGHL